MTVFANLSRRVANDFRKQTKSARRASRRRFLRLEVLEDRTLLTGLVMDQSVFDAGQFAANIEEQIPVNPFGLNGVVGYSYAIIDGDPDDPIAGPSANAITGPFAVTPSDNPGGAGVLGIPSSPDRPQEIASISKTVTGSTIMHLLQQQIIEEDPGLNPGELTLLLELELDRPIVNYLPAAWSAAGWAPNFATIDVGELLTHSSGLRNNTNLGGWVTTATLPGGGGGGFTGGGNIYNYTGLQQISQFGAVDPSKPTEYWTNNFAWFRVMLPYMWNEIDNDALDANVIINLVDMSELVQDDGLAADLANAIEEDWGITPLVSDVYSITPDRLTASIYKFYVSEYILKPSGIEDPQAQTTGPLPTLLYQIGAPIGVTGINTDQASFGTTPGGQLLNAGPRGWNLSAIEVAQFLSGIRHGAVDGSTILEQETMALMDEQFLGWREAPTNAPGSQTAAFTGDFGRYYGHDGVNFRAGVINQNTNNTQAMVFPNGVEAAFLINSQIQPTATALPSVIGTAFNVNSTPASGPIGTSTIATMVNAYDNAWTELVYDGDNIFDGFIQPGDEHDTFKLALNPISAANPTAPQYIDFFHDNMTTPVFTRRIDTLQKLTINGLDGVNIYQIEELPDSLEVVINGGGSADFVIVGTETTNSPSPTSDLDQFAPGTLTFNGGPGFNQLTIDDTNNGVGAFYEVTDDDVTRFGAGTYNYHNVDQLILNATNGPDDILVFRTAPGTTTLINTGMGADEVNIGIGDNNIAGPIVIQGGPNTGATPDIDTVRLLTGFLSSTPHDYVFNSNEVTVAGLQPIVYIDVEELFLSAGFGDDVVTVNSLNADQRLEIHTNGGADDVTINLLSSPLVTSVLGKVDVHGGSGTGDTLTINDATHFQSSDYTITGSTVARADVQPIGYDGVEQLSVFGGVSPSNYYIDSTSIPTTVWGNIQGDTFHVGANFVGDPDLNDIAAPLTIQGGENVGGEDTVFLNDTLGSNGAYVIQNELVTGNNFAAISLIDIDHAVLNASNLGVIVHVENAAGDTRYTVNGGFGNNTYHLAFGSKNLSSFNNPLIINGGLNDDHLILYDQSAPSIPDYQVTANSVDRIGFGEFSPFFPQIGVTFSSMSEVELNLNGGINTVNVQSTNPDTEYIFHGSGWDDTLNLNRHLDDAMDASISIDGTEISSANIDISYHQFGQLNVNLGPENTTVRIHDLVTDVDLNLGLGDDRVLVTPATGNLSNINFAIFVDGQGGHDQLVLHDQENPSAATYTITPDSVNRFFFGPLFGGEPGVRFVDLDEMRLLMGAHDDIANVNGTSPGTHYDLRGRRGDDTFNINVPPSSPVTLRGGEGSDTARIFGTRGDDEVSVSAGPGTADVNLVSIETASFDGFAGTDVLVYQGLPGVDEQVEVRASTTANQGTLRIVEVLDLLFQNTELIDLLANPSDADTAAFVGTDQDDRFEIDLSAAGTNADPVLRLVDPDSLDVLLSLRDYRNFGTLQVRGEDGADLFNVYALPAGPGTGRNLSVDGGSPSGPGNPKDELNVYREFQPPPPPPKPGPNPGNDSEGSIEVLYDLYEFLIDFWDIEKVKVLSNNAAG